MTQADTATMTLLVRPIVVLHKRCHEDEARRRWGQVARCRSTPMSAAEPEVARGGVPGDIVGAICVPHLTESSCPYTTAWQSFPASHRDWDIRMPSSARGG